MTYSKASPFSGGSGGGGSSPVTTEGDIIVGNGSGVEARVAIGTNTQVLTSNGTTAAWATPAGGGDVVGPASATDNAIARYDTTTGKLLQNSAVTIADTSGNMAGVGTLNTHTIQGGTGTLALTSDITGTNSGTNTGDQTNISGNAATVTTNADLTGDITSSGNATTYAGTLPVAKGGTGQTIALAGFDALQPMTTSGDIIYGGASGTGTRLAKGSDDEVLTLASGVPTWAAAGGGGPTVSSKAGNFTAADNFIYLVSSAAARAITLPSASAGTRFFIKDSTGSANTNNFTITRVSTEQIDGVAANRVLSSDWGSWTFVSDGTNWFIL